MLIAEGRPEGAGFQTAAALSKAGVPVTVVLDAAVGYHMEAADLCVTGAEGVLENGGIINKVSVGVERFGDGGAVRATAALARSASVFVTVGYMERDLLLSPWYRTRSCRLSVAFRGGGEKGNELTTDQHHPYTNATNRRRRDLK